MATTTGAEKKALDSPQKPIDNAEHNAEQSSTGAKALFGKEAANALSSANFDHKAVREAFAPKGSAYGDTSNELSTVVKDNNGNPLLQVRKRIGDSNEFKMSEYEGVGKNQRLVRTESERDVRRRSDGQIEYKRKSDGMSDVMVDLMLGESWLTAGDLPSAKEQFLDLAGDRLFKGYGGRQTAEKYVDMMVNSNHQRVKDGFKAASDDQLASALRSLSSIYETERTGSAKSLSMAQVDSRVESALKSLGDPRKYNNQGQVGSCGLNTCLFIAEKLHPDKVAKVFAQIMTKGEWRKHTFSTADMSAKSGRDSFNNVMTEALGNTFGFNDIWRRFRGTVMETEGRHAYKALTGDKLPFGRSALKKYGVAVAITMGGGHAQADELTKKGVYRHNWWNGAYEGKV